MNLLVIIFLFMLGLALIVKGGDMFVDAASWMAEVSGMPRFLIGATVVSFATTLPELLVSVIAAVEGRIDMSIGNAVGSVAVNTGLILGLSCAIAPSTVRRNQFHVKAAMMLVAAVAIMGLSRNGSLDMLACTLLIVLFFAFVAENISEARRDMTAGRESGQNKTAGRNSKETIKNIIMFIMGAGGIVIGADMMVDNGSALALSLGVPESLISATLVATGTSLPELVTCISALLKGQAALTVGNIIGANVIDLTLILPMSRFVSGKSLTVSSQSLALDIPAMCILVALAVIPGIFKNKLYRWQGIALISLYSLYIALLFMIF